MKLAEALRERADLELRLSDLGGRLRLNSRVQDGDEPSEDPEELMSEMDAVASRLEELIWRINTTNCMTRAEDGLSITQLIARRDVLRRRESVMRGFLDEASQRTSRYQKSEIVVRSTVDVRGLRKDVDELAAEIRRTDMRIQELNWTTDLV